MSSNNISTSISSGSGSITTKSNGNKIISRITNYNDSYSISMDFNNTAIKEKLSEEIKKEVINLLLNDPDNEIVELAENYLVGCVEEAMNAPDKNSVIKKYLSNIKKDLTETIDEKCGNLNIAIEKYLRENNYMDFSNTSNYIQYELENNPTNKIKVLQDRIDVLSKIVNDLCVKLEYFTYYDSSDYGTYSNGYEKTFRSQTGRG